MKKDRKTILAKIIYLLFVSGTIGAIFIVYNDINSKIAITFIISYVIIAFIFIMYNAIMTILNSRKLQRKDFKIRFSRFCILWALGYVFDYFISKSGINLMKEISIAFGASFGICFTEVTLLKEK
ncbi:hypothetical protein [Clostridium senegalense]